MQLPIDTLQFLRDLNENNNRPWFAANKPRYEAIHAALVEFCAGVISALSIEDPTVAGVDAKRCIYRIYRDVRFSPDKRPYQDHFSFLIPCVGDKNSETVGYYFHLAPGNCYMGGGVYCMHSRTSALMRQEVFYNSDRFLDIIHNDTYLHYFGTDFFDPNPLKTVPRGYDKEWPYAYLLKHRHYFCVHSVDDDKVSDSAFLDYTVDVLGAAVPFVQFFRQALEDLSPEEMNAKLPVL